MVGCSTSARKRVRPMAAMAAVSKWCRLYNVMGGSSAGLVPIRVSTTYPRLFPALDSKNSPTIVLGVLYHHPEHAYPTRAHPEKLVLSIQVNIVLSGCTLHEKQKQWVWSGERNQKFKICIVLFFDMISISDMKADQPAPLVCCKVCLI